MTKNIGQFWYKKLRENNQMYLSGSIYIAGGVLKNVRIFKNTHKTRKEQPDFKAYLFETDEKMTKNMEEDKKNA
jgi:hypothetical protein